MNQASHRVEPISNESVQFQTFGSVRGSEQSVGLDALPQYGGVAREELVPGNDEEISPHRHKAVNPLISHRGQMVVIPGEEIQLASQYSVAGRGLSRLLILGVTEILISSSIHVLGHVHGTRRK